MNFRAVHIFILCVTVLVTSCTSLGHRRVPTDNFNYNEAIGRAANEQMLLNLVRLRHFDVPVFLSVSSVLTQYVYSGTVSAEAVSANSGGSNADSATIGGRILYIERPTITYTPLTGQEFTEQLLTPISRATMFSLAQSGWPAEELLIMGLERLGPFKNLPLDVALPANEQALINFLEVIQLMLDLSLENAIEFRETNASDTSDLQSLVLYFNVNSSEQAKLKSRELKEKLKLDPNLNQFRIVNRITERKPDELLIRTRSMLDLMSHLARGVDGGNYVSPGERVIIENEELRTKLLPLNIEQSVDQPVNAFVSVKYNNNWYSISHSDHRSKQTFGMLTYVYLLQAPKPPTAGPLVTVPTG